MSQAAENRRIRALRPAKASVDPQRPVGVILEQERGPDGVLHSGLVVLLAGAECPFVCVHCDLWRHTLDGPTPRGALPRQVDYALASLDPAAAPEALKLYNAGNFFDRRAVPPGDLGALAARAGRFRRVTVECHPRLVGDRCLRFAERIGGRLEVAMGLETVHPEVLPRLNKQMSTDRFARAAEFLRGHGLGVRAFVLLSPPFMPPGEAVDWAVRSTAWALDAGVEVVSVIPMRDGAGELDRLRRAGSLRPPSLAMLEEALMRGLALGRGVVLADLWDVEAVAGCDRCRQSRIDHLRAMNRTGRAGRALACNACGAGAT